MTSYLNVFLLTLMCVTFTVTGAEPVSNAPKFVQQFLQDYCIKCHGPEKQKADLRYDTLAYDFQDFKAASIWQDILDQLDMEEMPPKKPFPSSVDSEKIKTWIQQKLELGRIAVKKKHQETKSHYQRLKHSEFHNTLKDLFDFDLPHLDHTQSLTRDSYNIESKDKLKMSPTQFQGYLKVIDRVLDSVFLPVEQPKAKTWVIRPEDMLGARDVCVYHMDKHGLSYADLFGVETNVARCWVEKGLLGVPFDGKYKISITAEALYPDPKRPAVLDVSANSREYGRISSENISDYHLKNITIQGPVKEYRIDSVLKRGFMPYLRFQNGLGYWSQKITDVVRESHKITNSYLTLGKHEVARKYSKHRRIRVHSLKVTGPFFDTWPQPITHKWLGDLKENPLTLDRIEPILLKFAKAAWRRHILPTEISDIVTYVKNNFHQKPLHALKQGFKVILMSSNHLYHIHDHERVQQFALAARLSYFLWNEPPDQELQDLAQSGQLENPKVYSAQIKRLLDDPRLLRMINSFTTEWLQLYRLDLNPPDKKMFKKFYSARIKHLVKREPIEFMKVLFKENLSIFNCLKSDFAVVDPKLAKFYELPVPKSGFQKVALQKSSIRGGLVTQPAIASLTSNGQLTSPVVRGIYVMERILGIHPAPPPSDVEIPEPDIRGAKSLVEQLKKHRDQETCMECHRKIDPLGIPLENLDAIGQFRDTYKPLSKVAPSHPVIAHATTTNGTNIQNLNDYTSYLLDRKSQFSKNLTERLFTYSIGRKVSYLDRESVDEIVHKLTNSEENGFRDLLSMILQSPLFKDF